MMMDSSRKSLQAIKKTGILMTCCKAVKVLVNH